MRILMLAPHPFFQQRGTPIAVDMLVSALSDDGHQVDLLTFAEGEDRAYRNARIIRAQPRPSLSNIGPGFSLKKLYNDWFLFLEARRLLSREHYDVVHAVEETAFMGWLFHKTRRTPFVYDMDSLLSTQLSDKSAIFRFLSPLTRRLERLPLRAAAAVAPMCQALADEALDVRQNGVFVIKDVSLIGEGPEHDARSLRDEFSITGPLILYVGNLEPYQGIDLLLAAFEEVSSRHGDATLVIVGGSKAHIEHYRQQVRTRGLEQRMIFAGAQPVEQLGGYLKQADVLVSPRVQGANTPMKIYSYLHSGVPTVATDLPTHTQVLGPEIAALAAPDPAAFGAAIERLLDDENLRARLGNAARTYARREHGKDKFVESVRNLYRYLEQQVCAAR